MSIREATEADWSLIWPIFDEVVQAGETYAFPLDLTPETARGWWMERPPGRTVVLEEDGRVLGTAKMGPNRPGRGDHVGTASFMVAVDARGRGVGRRLGEHVVDWHREQGYRGIQLNAVVETNTAAVRLWEDLGLGVLGTVPGAFRSAAHGAVGLHLMYLPLSAQGEPQPGARPVDTSGETVGDRRGRSTATTPDQISGRPRIPAGTPPGSTGTAPRPPAG